MKGRLMDNVGSWCRSNDLEGCQPSALTRPWGTMVPASLVDRPVATVACGLRQRNQQTDGEVTFGSGSSGVISSFFKTRTGSGAS